MTTRPHSRPALHIIVAVLASSCAMADGVSNVVDYRPADEVPRLQPSALPGPELGRVADFDVAGDRLYLLEVTGRLLMLTRSDSGWIDERELGRSGDGPGEFRYPTGISATGDGIAVAEANRLHFFAADGNTRDTRVLRLPCVMPRPRVTLTQNSTFVYGDCQKLAYRTDTTVAVLAWSRGGDRFEIIAREPRFTRDGKVGSIFNVAEAFSSGLSGTHWFGVATTNCLWRITDTDVKPLVIPECPAAITRYRADAPAALRERLKKREVAGMKVRWPSTLPVFVSRLPVDDVAVLLRPFTADSLVLQLTAPLGADIAVAPFEGFVNCRAAGCLWVRDREERSEILLLDIDAARQLVKNAREQL